MQRWRLKNEYRTGFVVLPGLGRIQPDTLYDVDLSAHPQMEAVEDDGFDEGDELPSTTSGKHASEPLAELPPVLTAPEPPTLSEGGTGANEEVAKEEGPSSEQGPQAPRRGRPRKEPAA